jgi:carbamoyl-phosphate synthase small subunit
MSQLPPPPPPAANAALVLADGSVFWGHGLGAAGRKVGELCFNTSMTGYQEIMTDPSYAGQIITFTFPHIGNVGANPEDIEAATPAARGCVLARDITQASNWRTTVDFSEWLRRNELPGIAGVDTRRLTRRLRDAGAATAVIVHAPDGNIDIDAALAAARTWPGLEGMDLAKDVTTRQTYQWEEALWQPSQGYGRLAEPRRHVVAIDYGAKRTILRNLAALGCGVTVLPAAATAAEVMRHRPDGIFLSNGPGDPAALAGPIRTIGTLIETGKPIFGICLGHQLLGLALGATTFKLKFGHRGANHPVKDLASGRVEITSQNHGFAVDPSTLPADTTVTHQNLYDGTVEGFKHTTKPIFSVQYHPEASPGPHDADYLFRQFLDAMEKR